MDLNRDLIQQRFQDIRQSLERLERIKEIPKEAFLSNQDTLDLACYRLLVAIEAVIQICFHVCARQLQRVPEEYAEGFAILGEAGIIPPQLSRNLQKMARFRNLLVHLYWSVDYERLYDIIRENLDDLRQFVRAIGKLL